MLVRLILSNRTNAWTRFTRARVETNQSHAFRNPSYLP